MKGTILLILVLLILTSLAVLPVHAAGGPPPVSPEYQATPVPQSTAPARSAPTWVGILLVFVLPFLYMIITSWGKKEPSLQPPGADLPVFHDGARPFKPYDDEDENS